MFITQILGKCYMFMDSIKKVKKQSLAIYVVLIFLFLLIVYLFSVMYSLNIVDAIGDSAIVSSILICIAAYFLKYYKKKGS